MHAELSPCQIANSQFSNPAAAQVLLGVEIFRCENAIFHQRGERVHKFCLERFGMHFGFGMQMERECSVKLFLSSTVSKDISGSRKFLVHCTFSSYVICKRNSQQSLILNLYILMRAFRSRHRTDFCLKITFLPQDNDKF